MTNFMRLIWSKIVNDGGGYILTIITLCIIYGFVKFCTIFIPQEYSNRISDWGDFAACLGTILSFVSVVFVYSAYIKQLEASKQLTELSNQQLEASKQLTESYKKQTDFSKQQSELIKEQCNILFQTSFNQLFVSYLKTLKDIYDIDGKKSFLEMENYIYKNTKNEISNNLEKLNENEMHIYRIIEKEYDTFLGKHPDSDIKYYFKYLYHIISFVDRTNNINKAEYISMIQAQMSKAELFCYLINIIETRSRKSNNISEITQSVYIQLLDKYNFFEDLHIDKIFYDKIIKNIYPNTTFYNISKS